MVNSRDDLLNLFFMGDQTFTPQSFNRFLHWLDQGPIDLIFKDLVRFGISLDLLSLKELLTDSGPVEALVNPKRVLTFPKRFRRGLFQLFKQLDFSLFSSLDRSVQGKRYSVVLKLKTYLSQILLGLGSLSQLYTFMAKYPDLKTILSPDGKVPEYQTMVSFVEKLHTDPGYLIACQSLLDQLVAVLRNISPKTLPTRYETLEDLFGTLGTKYSRVDRGARIGIKSKNGKHWYGYKDHVTCDRLTGLPVLVTTTSANVADEKEFKTHLGLIKTNYGDLINVEKWTADKGYDKAEYRRIIQDQYNAKAQLCRRDPNKEEEIEQKRWNSERQGVELVISRAKLFGRKNNPRVRSRWRVNVWVKTSYLLVLIIGISMYIHGEPERIREVSFYLY